MAGGDGFERGSSGEGVSDEDAASFHDDDDDDDGTADTFDQALEAELADEDDQGAQKPNEWSWDERNDRAGANERTSSLSSKSGKKRALESDSECRHEVVWFGMCTECGEAVNESEEAEKSSSRVKFQYVAGGVEATQERAETLKEEQLRIALSNRKFLLVLDLDHTLVNTCLLSDLNQEELDILTNWERQEELHFWSGSDLCTKFRPNCWQFLSRVSELCDLYVFTMGNREYAEQVVTMLDPDGTRFSSRVISAQDASEESSKSLDIVVGKEEGVLIVDDSPNVWRNHEDNVIPIERYLFFPPSAHHFFPSGHSLLELHSDENASDDPSSCPLMAILDVICSIHSSYFNLIDSGLVGLRPSLLLSDEVACAHQLIGIDSLSRERMSGE